MSRIAKEPVKIPDKVRASVENGIISVIGPKGALEMSVHPAVKVLMKDQLVTVAARHSTVKSRAMSGTTRSLFNNMVIGVSEGFEKRLTLIGTGYRAKADGSTVNLSLGFSHPIVYQASKEITFHVESESSAQVKLVVRGIDKQEVGQVAADLRRMRPPEPYKGKGVRYSDERVRRKTIKSVG